MRIKYGAEGTVHGFGVRIVWYLPRVLASESQAVGTIIGGDLQGIDDGLQGRCGAVPYRKDPDGSRPIELMRQIGIIAE